MTTVKYQVQNNKKLEFFASTIQMILWAEVNSFHRVSFITIHRETLYTANTHTREKNENTFAISACFSNITCSCDTLIRN